MNQHNQDSEKSYVAPFIRGLKAGATEDQILEASESLRRYLLIMWGIFLRQEEERWRSQAPSPTHPYEDDGAPIGPS